MKWRQYANLPGIECYGMRWTNGITFVVTFDHKFPEKGWRASYKRHGQTYHMDAPFQDKLTAMQRVCEQARCE